VSAKVTEKDMHALFDRVKNWGRWGKDDQAGALNYITPEKRVAAAKLIRSGRTVSCARNFPVRPAPENPWPALHHMVIAGDDPCIPGVPGLEASTDFIGIAFHGLASSHIDALCHVFVEGKMYNGFDATDVKSTGARRNSIMCAKDGIVGRGVLLDIPAVQGRRFVDPDHEITLVELNAAEAKAGVKVEEGDILLVYTGRDVRAREAPDAPSDGVKLVGLHPETIPFLHERRIAVLGADGVHDPQPPGRVENWPIPVHMCALVAMGVHLLDNLYLEDLAQACTAEKRWEFLLTVAPLRIAGGTGSPVNPIATF
jgi:kynurenine formamidase